MDDEGEEEALEEEEHEEEEQEEEQEGYPFFCKSTAGRCHCFDAVMGCYTS